ncbi:MAG TPA: hypothetical protein VHL31_19660, partial [Geminicoccus sp.]|nr:hypothetical protein [Geminicoccus sp.]
MNRTIKDATIKVFHYPDPEALKAHVLTFVTACSFARHYSGGRLSRPSATPGRTTPPSSEAARTTSSRNQPTRE